MERRVVLFCILLRTVFVNAINLNYLDPTKLQTVASPSHQRDSARSLISRYAPHTQINVEVDFDLFKDKKDTFHLKTTTSGSLNITASSGVAAVWGFNYFLKKYCKSQIDWQTGAFIRIPVTLPEIDEVIVANDRFRYYQNVCTASYSFVWWDPNDWSTHLDWMALNGINLVLAPVPQEAIWTEIYKNMGMTDEEIQDHFTGPAFLSWLRMGNVRGWGGPLPKSWHILQQQIASKMIDRMNGLGMIPVFPAFNGHVPKAFARIFPDTKFFSVDTWNGFDNDHCCGLFVDPNSPLFKTIGETFLKKITRQFRVSNHVYSVDPFNEVKINPWSSELVQNTSKAIFSVLSEVDDKAVWLVQNWMFVHDPVLWPRELVRSFLMSVPNGRMLVLDLQSEQWPQYNLYQMYYGQPFIWCMLHNFGGTLGMFGNMRAINEDVYAARTQVNNTMIGIGLTPEGINQNYVVYDLMLESAWRPGPVDLEAWVAEYAERRYGCNSTATAWKYLLKSVYSFDGLNKIRGKYVITRRPSFSISPWAWYKSRDLFNAFKHFSLIDDPNCVSNAFDYDLVDVTRQALQYRAEQLYINLLRNRMSTSWVFNASSAQYLDAMTDIERILYNTDWFTASRWFQKARSIGNSAIEEYTYEYNARNQITLWGPNGEISDYACKQWAEVFRYYYIPRWRTFLEAALDAKIKREVFDERKTLLAVKRVEEEFGFVHMEVYQKNTPIRNLALELFKKWGYVSGLEDLPFRIIKKVTNLTFEEA